MHWGARRIPPTTTATASLGTRPAAPGARRIHNRASAVRWFAERLAGRFSPTTRRLTGRIHLRRIEGTSPHDVVLENGRSHQPAWMAGGRTPRGRSPRPCSAKKIPGDEVFSRIFWFRWATDPPASTGGNEFAGRWNCLRRAPSGGRTGEHRPDLTVTGRERGCLPACAGSRRWTGTTRARHHANPPFALARPRPGELCATTLTEDAGAHFGPP